MRFDRFIISFALGASAASLVSCSSESDAVNRKECEQLRDHIVELRMQSVTADREEHRKAIRSAFGEDFIESCIESTPSNEIQCALASNDGDSLRACSESTTR